MKPQRQKKEAEQAREQIAHNERRERRKEAVREKICSKCWSQYGSDEQIEAEAIEMQVRKFQFRQSNMNHIYGLHHRTTWYII